MRIGDPSSKYAYGRSLDLDIQDKHEKYEEVTTDIVTYMDLVLNEQVKYNDGSVMSRSNKLNAMREAYRQILIQEGEL